jgi:hypothetical protein
MTDGDSDSGGDRGGSGTVMTAVTAVSDDSGANECKWFEYVPQNSECITLCTRTLSHGSRHSHHPGSYHLHHRFDLGFDYLEEEKISGKTQNEKQLDTEAASANRFVTVTCAKCCQTNQQECDQRLGIAVEKHWISDMRDTLTASRIACALHGCLDAEKGSMTRVISRK